MAAPFEFPAVSRVAESMADDLRKLDTYRDDVWNDAVLGPLLRVYALLTHRPDLAFDSPPTAEHVAESRAYAAVLHSAVYDKLVNAMTVDDTFFDLATEYDSLVGADLFGAMETAKTDAIKHIEMLGASPKCDVKARPDSVKRID